MNAGRSGRRFTKEEMRAALPWWLRHACPVFVLPFLATTLFLFGEELYVSAFATGTLAVVVGFSFEWIVREWLTRNGYRRFDRPTAPADRATENLGASSYRRSLSPKDTEGSARDRMPSTDLEQLVLAMPYARWLGLSLDRIADGEVDFVMPFKEEITFDGRIVQAGPIAALLDFAGGTAALTIAPRSLLATADFTVKLLAPAVGERFVGRGRVVSVSRSTTVARADVYAYTAAPVTERHVATALVTMHKLGERHPAGRR